MAISVKQINFHVLNMKARMPFRYGIAALVAVPHLFVRVTAEVNGKTTTGLAADGLPPKWFTKNPEASFEDDLDEMFAVIRNACGLAESVGQADTVFDFWKRVYDGQAKWAASTTYPPLLWGFGVSLVERAVMDAFCRGTGTTFERALRTNAFGIRLEAIHSELAGIVPEDLLPGKALRSIRVRHTVGLSDPLTDADILADERVNDGLPQSLEANLKAYGLARLKIKLCGDAERDLDRLKAIAGLMEKYSGAEYAFTLDGNEQYSQIEPFRELWDAIEGAPGLARFMRGLIFVEQPLKRDVALGPEAARVLKGWTSRPPMIIDESDGELTSAATALENGYVGTSHKNCKGIFKGVANACLMALRRKKDPGGAYVLSSEDLGNVGPVALLQDLAVLASLGIGHSERNGHHYFAGLSMYPEVVQAQALGAHGDLYRKYESGFPALNIQAGMIEVGSVVDAPFGYGFELDSTQFTPLADWSVDSLDI